MPYLLKRSWYPGGGRLAKAAHQQASRKNSRSDTAQESEWLGWDGWVNTGDVSNLRDETTEAV